MEDRPSRLPRSHSPGSCLRNISCPWPSRTPPPRRQRCPSERLSHLLFLPPVPAPCIAACRESSLAPSCCSPVSEAGRTAWLVLHLAAASPTQNRATSSLTS